MAVELSATAVWWVRVCYGRVYDGVGAKQNRLDVGRAVAVGVTRQRTTRTKLLNRGGTIRHRPPSFALASCPSRVFRTSSNIILSSVIKIDRSLSFEKQY